MPYLLGSFCYFRRSLTCPIFELSFFFDWGRCSDQDALALPLSVIGFTWLLIGIADGNVCSEKNTSKSEIADGSLFGSRLLAIGKRSLGSRVLRARVEFESGTNLAYV